MRYWGKDSVLFRGGQCGTEERTVWCSGEDSAQLRRGECVTEEKTVR